ncbi:MAG: ABC transporter ATP-binding protein [Acidimicrobiia bacterium]|nr:ABC transporter ATP-binding protein [Acidimicrobiia bacterium]
MADSLSTVAAIRRAFREAPVLGDKLWLPVVFNMGGTVVQLLIPVLVQLSIDRYLEGPGRVDMAAILTIAGIGLLAVVVGGLLTRAGLVRLVKQATTGLSDLRVSVFDHLLRRSVLHVQTEGRGSLVSRVTSDMWTLQEFMEWGGVMFLVNGTQVSATLVVMFAYDWRLALLVLLGASVYAASLLWFQRILRRRYDKVRATVASSLTVMGEAISGLPSVRAYAAEAVTQRRVDEALEARFRAEFKAGHFGNVLFATSEIFAAALTAGVVVGGLLLGVGGGVTAGVLLAFLFLVNLLISPVQMMVEILDFAQSAASGLRRIIEALDAPVEIAEPLQPVALPGGNLSIEFEGVSYRYPTGPEVLSHVNAAIDSGRRVAVVGETGSGKTTFSKLLVRLLDPIEGTVRIGGVDLRDVALVDLRRRVTFVPQEGFLVTGTVAENVRYGMPNATDRDLRTAFIELGLDGWLDGLVSGLATSVGERGSSMSAGERQLIALVRAWIAAPDLLVLDEATSAVDPALDVALRHAMERLTAGRTTVTIAHRLATAESADEVLVFDEGRLVERGTHQDLLANNGHYQRLYADWAAGTATR